MKLYASILFIVIAFTSCKKDNDKEDKISYDVSVKVADNVGYKLEIKDYQSIIRDVRPGVANMSITETISYESNTNAFVKVTTVPHYKDEVIEITVAKSNGEIIKKETGKENITVSWLVK